MEQKMRKIKVGIVGYGNLGKSVEKEIKNSNNFELIAIFSRRKLNNTLPVESILNYKEKIDLLFLCGGSQNELEQQAMKYIEDFNIIESYDNHARLKEFHKKLESVAKKSGKVALCSFGWDPGLFSFMRGLFDALGYKPYTFWGRGVSQGHTQAIKNIDGVCDAIQFTIPDTEKIEEIAKGKNVQGNLHKRECFVVADANNHERIEREIKTMPNYFVGYETTVNFVSQGELEKIKNFSHQGQVMTKNNTLNFSLHLSSNPDFTAKVVTSFARAFESVKNKRGVYTIFDLPLKTILRKDFYKFL